MQGHSLVFDLALGVLGNKALMKTCELEDGTPKVKRVCHRITGLLVAS